VVNTAPAGLPDEPIEQHASDLALVAEQVVAAVGSGCPPARRLVRGAHG
jgi:hypothetical protein